MFFKIRKTPHYNTCIYIYIYSELVQQLQTVTRALQTTNSASTEQLKYFKQFFHTIVSFLLTVTLPRTEGQGKCELQPLIPLSGWFLCHPSQSSKSGPCGSCNCASCIGSQEVKIPRLSFHIWTLTYILIVSKEVFN